MSNPTYMQIYAHVKLIRHAFQITDKFGNVTYVLVFICLILNYVIRDSNNRFTCNVQNTQYFRIFTRPFKNPLCVMSNTLVDLSGLYKASHQLRLLAAN